MSKGVGRWSIKDKILSTWFVKAPQPLMLQDRNKLRNGQKIFLRHNDIKQLQQQRLNNKKTDLTKDPIKKITRGASAQKITQHCVQFCCFLFQRIQVSSDKFQCIPSNQTNFNKAIGNKIKKPYFFKQSQPIFDLKKNSEGNF